jgi:type VI secretion system protein ImpC
MPATPRAAGAVDALIRRIVAPHIVPDRAPHQPVYLAAVDTAIGEQMRQLLHAPVFSALETAWRSVHWLVSRLELNEDLQLHLLDVTRDELRADLLAAPSDLSGSGLYRLLRRPGADGDRQWSLCAVLMSVGPGADDLSLLARLGAVASQTGGPVIAAAAPALFGCNSVADLPDPLRWQPLAADVAERWTALRRSAVAPWIGLVAPRILLRLPYGRSTDPTERFGFEEQPAVPIHETLLWAPGSLAIALLVGQAFVEGGWERAGDPAPDLDDLPAYTFRRDGEPQLQPCGEAWLGERAGAALLGKGLMPLLSDRRRAAVRLTRMQSVAEPTQALAGPWG